MGNITPGWPTDRQPDDIGWLMVEGDAAPDAPGWHEIRGPWWQRLKMWWADRRVRIFWRDDY